jgi:hypothetical protein
MEIITYLLHARFDGRNIPVYFIVYYTFAGLIVFATVPFYVIFGNHFRKHLESYPGASKDPSILKLKRKILFLSYAPGSLLIISFVVIGLAVRYSRRDPSLFLIGESLARFFEMITMGVFVFALFTRREGDDDDPFNEDGQDHGRAMSFKSSSEGDDSTLRRGAYFLDDSTGSEGSSYSSGYHRAFLPPKTMQDPFSSVKHQGAMF